MENEKKPILSQQLLLIQQVVTAATLHLTATVMDRRPAWME